MSGFGGHRTLGSGFWCLGQAQQARGPLQLPVSCLGQARLGWACCLRGHSCTRIWGPFPPSQAAQTPVPSVSSVLTLPPGGRMEDGAQGHKAPVPGILTGPPAPPPGHQNPNVIQNSREPRQGDTPCLPDQWSCAPLPDSFFPASLAALGGHRPSSKQ